MYENTTTVRRIRELISECQLLSRSEEEHFGKKRFFKFIRESVACVCALEDKIPSSAKAMSSMRWTHVVEDEGDEAAVSENAYRDDYDELRDFDYRSFQLAAKHLRTAEARCLIDQDLRRESVGASPAPGSPISVCVPADVRDSKAEPSISDLPTWPDALDDKAVAKLLQMKVATLRKWRMSPNKGPKFLRVGSRVRYEPKEVFAYMESRRRNAASE
jgi:hypothetical protein